MDKAYSNAVPSVTDQARSLIGWSNGCHLKICAGVPKRYEGCLTRIWWEHLEA